MILNKLTQRFLGSRISQLLSDKRYISLRYRHSIGKRMNWRAPKTFNEKLQWLKLYDRNPQYTQLVDKQDVKQIVSNQIGADYVIPTLGVWGSFDDIDFDKLPDKFVLKCTHDSGGIAICKDKNIFDKNLAKNNLERSLKTNYFYSSREWPYKDVKPRIIAEQYIADSNGELLDYKFMCFNGEVKCSFVCSDRFSGNGLHVTFFDRDWNVMPFERSYPSVKDGLPKPEKYDEMISLAETLSKGIPFVRIDLYEVDGKIYFGEFTFYPGSGYEAFQPEEWDYTLGSWINLNGTR